MPAGGAGMVALESSAKIPRHGGGEKKAEWTKLPLPRTRQKPQATTAGRCRSRAREGNHSGVFSTTAAAVPAAMKGLFASRDRRCSDSAHTNAGAPWSAFGSGNGVGGNTDSQRVPDDLEIVPTY
jgi:hypothetical protein